MFVDICCARFVENVWSTMPVSDVTYGCMYDYARDHVCCVGAVDLIMRMFPPFPIPGFAPNFTGYTTDWHEIDWYETYEFMAQPTNWTVMWVSFWTIVCKTVGPVLLDHCLSVCLSTCHVTLVYCGQTVGWINMPLGTEVGLGPDDIVLDMNPAPPPGFTERGTVAYRTFRPN